MNTAEKEKFESLWSNFTALVRGKLINAASKQTLSDSLASLILSDAASSWGSNYELNGRWLSNLKASDPEKAALIGEILLNDMKFTDVEPKRDLPAYCNVVIPAVGACAGLAISICLHGSKLVQAISTIVPALLLYPAVNTFRKNMHESNNDKLIDNYMQQLQKYRDSIISLLS